MDGADVLGERAGASGRLGVGEGPRYTADRGPSACQANNTVGCC